MLKLKSDLERFAQVAHDKRANHSGRSLHKSEHERLICSGHSWQKSERANCSFFWAKRFKNKQFAKHKTNCFYCKFFLQFSPFSCQLANHSRSRCSLLIHCFLTSDVSKFLRLLWTKERPEWIAHIALYKRVIVSNLLRSLRTKEQKSKWGIHSKNWWANSQPCCSLFHVLIMFIHMYICVNIVNIKGTLVEDYIIE